MIEPTQLNNTHFLLLFSSMKQFLRNYKETYWFYILKVFNNSCLKLILQFLQSLVSSVNYKIIMPNTTQSRIIGAVRGAHSQL